MAIRRLGAWSHVSIECLPAALHNQPERIPAAVREKLEKARGSYAEIFVAYADCGTGGHLDVVLEEFGVERLPGAHCYEFLTGPARFAELNRAEPGTFYLTDFLVLHFERLVIRSLGLDRHPELLADYFGNYEKAVYLAQVRTAEREQEARRCAQRLALSFECVETGLGPLADILPRFGDRSLEDAIAPEPLENFVRAGRVIPNSER